jgi:hypothetical protein
MYSTITGRNFCDEEVPKGKSPQTFYYEQMFKEISTRKCMEQIRKRFRPSSNPDLDVADHSARHNIVQNIYEWSVYQDKIKIRWTRKLQMSLLWASKLG